ncbi:unnamed protein product [Pieris macdunnoughi]|uniref:Uncharacterized protein n=1 Tax=Pieris macdunnoughi TaxID=345717 RepID=A0A821XHN1_9NEOP|nr:unnamed protein product [Pieris macdunnoughi]
MADAATALKFKWLDQETQKTMRKLFPGERGGFVRIGPKGYLVTERYKEMAADIYNMEIRPSDVWVVTYARSDARRQFYHWVLDRRLITCPVYEIMAQTKRISKEKLK